MPQAWGISSLLDATRSNIVPNASGLATKDLTIYEVMRMLGLQVPCRNGLTNNTTVTA